MPDFVITCVVDVAATRELSTETVETDMSTYARSYLDEISEYITDDEDDVDDDVDEEVDDLDVTVSSMASRIGLA